MEDLEKTFHQHEIGWQWFQMHAQQRMQLVSFWFVAMSFLSGATIVAYSDKHYGASAAGAFFIAFASVLFLLLDRRTRELIRYGEDLMAATEQALLANSPTQIEMVKNMHDSNRREPSYRLIFSLLYGGAAMVAVIALVASAVQITN